MSETRPGRAAVGWIAAFLVTMSVWGAVTKPPERPAASAPAEPSARVGAPAEGDVEAAILDPTQGRPIILVPGSEFRFLLRLGPGVEGGVALSIRHCRARSVSTQLSLVGKAIFQQRYASMALKLPKEAPGGLYDLVLKSRSTEIVAPRSIKVVQRYRSQFRFVHLSDMTIDDPSAPQFDDRLVEEVNLLAPEFIVATGDYTAWGRALDDPGTWRRVLAWLAGFDAPVYMVCGDQDHEAGFSRTIAQSPIGTFDYGPYHGVLLLDHAHHALDQDQVDFLHRDLDANPGVVFNMLVSHNDGAAWLNLLSPQESLGRYLKSRKVRLIITGGSDDWDGTEHAARFKDLDGVHYIRTHQSSTCLRGRSTGVSHYRVIEVDGDQVSYAYPDEAAEPGVRPSIPVGRLRVFREAEGTDRVTVHLQNALNQTFRAARVWIEVAKSGSAPPQVVGGQLVQALDAGDRWACEVEADLPDKGGVKLLVTTKGSPPPPVPVTCTYEGDTGLVFKSERTEAGLGYFTSDQPVRIKLKNTSDRPIKTFPAVRLNGSLLSVAGVDADTWPIAIPASGEVSLVPRLILGRVSEGEHLMQLMFLEDAVRRVTTFPVTLKRQGGGLAQAPTSTRPG